MTLSNNISEVTNTPQSIHCTFPLEILYNIFNAVVKDHIFKIHVCLNDGFYFHSIKAMTVQRWKSAVADSNVSNNLVEDNVPPASVKVKTITIATIILTKINYYLTMLHVFPFV